MVKYNNEWGTICKDDFTYTSLEAACHTLGLDYTKGAGYSYRKSETGDKAEEDMTRIWMKDIHCEFLECPEKSTYYSDYRNDRDCTGHWNDVVLTCT